MEDRKMLQAILENQAQLKKELTETKTSLETKIDNGFKNVNQRLDMQGKQLAELDEDAPTMEEHNKLEKRVTKIEKKVALVP